MQIAQSQVQKHFKIHEVYKRSRHIIDIQKMMQQEHLMEIYRRKPSSSVETLDTRVDNSFVNTMDLNLKKLQEDISESKKRYYEHDVEQSEQNSTVSGSLRDTATQNEPSPSKKRIRGIDIRKMTGRKDIMPNQCLYQNQDQFNNFTLSTSRSKAMVNFQLHSPRSKTSLFEKENPEAKEIDSFETSKIKQKNTFNSSVYRCLFDLSKINKYAHQSRKIKQQQSPKQIDLQKLESARKMSRKSLSPGLSNFYSTVGKGVPAQMDVHYTRNNQFFYNLRENDANQNDYVVKKMKKEMVQKRLDEILKRKKVKDEKGEICDYKFFKRAEYRKL